MGVLKKKGKQYRYLFAESDTMKIVRLCAQVFVINNCHRYEKIVFRFVCSCLFGDNDN